MRLTTSFSLTAVCCASMLHTSDAGAGSVHWSASYSSVRIPNDVSAALQAKGINIAAHLPAHLTKGPHQLNRKMMSH
jgi:hypothetical protein